jgi:nitrogen fixation NifU-like protein
MYNEIVQDCFFLPQHVGVIDLAFPLTVYFRSSQNNQSVTKIELYLQCTKSALINKACFRATGNPYVIAALEWLCRQIEGRELESLISINYQTLIKELEIPTHQYPIALQVEDAYKEVLTLMKKKLEDYKS